MKPDVAILVEARVKKNKVKAIRRKLGKNWKFIDSYTKHGNGRLWIAWDPNKVSIDLIIFSSQMIHCKFASLSGIGYTWCTIIYAFNKPDQRKLLWNAIGKLQLHIQYLWFLMGDFNNVVKTHDIFGRNEVHESEYINLENMMDITCMFEKDSVGEFSLGQTRKQIESFTPRLIEL